MRKGLHAAVLVVGGLAACDGQPSPFGVGEIVGDVLIGGPRPERPLSQALGPDGHHVIFLNFDGVTLSPNNDNSAHNQSSIAASVGHNIVVPPFDSTVFATSKPRAQVIADIVAKTKFYYQDFNIEVVSTRPTSGNYVMVAIGGLPDLIGQPCSNGGCVLGLAPLDCAVSNNGQIIYNYQDDVEVVFGFSDTVKVFGGTYNEEITTIVTTNCQETAHAYGLGHESLTTDVMYPEATGTTLGFLDKASTYADSNNCAKGQGTQDSHAVLLATLGASGTTADTTPPVVTISSPVKGATVGRHFVVTASGTDNVGVDHISLVLQGTAFKGTMTFSGSSANWPITATSDGAVSITATAYDAVGNQSPTDTISVTVKSGTLGGFGATCTSGSQCSSGLCQGGICTQTCGTCPSGYTCTAGVCAAQQMASGGQTGADCSDGSGMPDSSKCISGICATQGSQNYCTANCDTMTVGSCPSNMICQDQGGGSSVCVFPAASGGGSSCSVAGAGDRGAGLALMVLLGLSLLAVNRRRRS